MNTTGSQWSDSSSPALLQHVRKFMQWGKLWSLQCNYNEAAVTNIIWCYLHQVWMERFGAEPVEGWKHVQGLLFLSNSVQFTKKKPIALNNQHQYNNSGNPCKQPRPAGSPGDQRPCIWSDRPPWNGLQGLILIKINSDRSKSSPLP